MQDLLRRRNALLERVVDTKIDLLLVDDRESNCASHQSVFQSSDLAYSLSCDRDLPALLRESQEESPMQIHRKGQSAMPSGNPSLFRHGESLAVSSVVIYLCSSELRGLNIQRQCLQHRSWWHFLIDRLRDYERYRRRELTTVLPLLSAMMCWLTSAPPSCSSPQT